jgi:hypothetical protein
MCYKLYGNGGIIGMDTGLDGGVPIGDRGRVGAICLQFGDELFVDGFGLAINAHSKYFM